MSRRGTCISIRNAPELLASWSLIRALECVFYLLRNGSEDRANLLFLNVGTEFLV